MPSNITKARLSGISFSHAKIRKGMRCQFGLFHSCAKRGNCDPKITSHPNSVENYELLTFACLESPTESLYGPFGFITLKYWPINCNWTFKKSGGWNVTSLWRIQEALALTPLDPQITPNSASQAKTVQFLHMPILFPNWSRVPSWAGPRPPLYNARSVRPKALTCTCSALISSNFE